MSKSDPSLLAELKAGLRNGKTSMADMLNQCILLGGEVGSERLRDWARKELMGYGNAETLLDYRRVAASLCIDGYVPAGTSRVRRSRCSRFLSSPATSSMKMPRFLTRWPSSKTQPQAR